MPAMEPRKGTDLLVVGGGIGGAATALRAAQYGIRATWVMGNRKTRRASRSAYVLNVDNMIGVHPGCVTGALIDIVRRDHPEAPGVAESLRNISTQDIIDNARDRIEADFPGMIDIVDARAESATRAPSGFTLHLEGGAPELQAPFMVLATGVMDRQPIIHKMREGRDLSGIHWLFPYANHETILYCIRCEGHLTRGVRTAVIGSGPAAAEVSLMLRERYDVAVTLLTGGEDATWGGTQGRLLDALSVRILTSRLVDIEGADRGSVLKGFALEDGTRVEVDRALVAMGLQRVYNDLAIDLGAALEESGAPPALRHVLVDGNGETDVSGLFAVGDLARGADGPLMKQIYTAQEFAVRAVDAIDRRIRRRRRERLLDDRRGE